MDETEEPHDILAADEFPVPARRSDMPPDPTGIQEPHDVLAAEEFAMPTGGTSRAGRDTGTDPRSFLPLLAIGLTALLVLRARRSR